jgi:hypothetical protein
MPAPKELLKYWKWFEANDEEYSHRSLKAKPNAPKEAKGALEKFYKPDFAGISYETPITDSSVAS